MNLNNNKFKLLIELLILEKVLQHLVTAYFYLFSEIKPNYGSTFILNYETLGIFNITFMILFVISFYSIFVNQMKAKYIIIFPNVLDILSEFIFHHLGYITISVIVSTIIILLVIISWNKLYPLDQYEYNTG